MHRFLLLQVLTCPRSSGNSIFIIFSLPVSLSLFFFLIPIFHLSSNQLCLSGCISWIKKYNLVDYPNGLYKFASLLPSPLNRFFKKVIPQKAFLFCGLILRVPSTFSIITTFYLLIWLPFMLFEKEQYSLFSLSVFREQFCIFRTRFQISTLIQRTLFFHSMWKDCTNNHPYISLDCEE